MSDTMKAADICQAVGVQVMDALNEGGVMPVATIGTTLPDGTFEFVLGPVYLPSPEVSLTAPTETRRLYANLRLETEDRPVPRHVQWLCKRGDDDAEMDQPTQAIVIDEILAAPGEDVVTVRYHLSAR